MKWRYQPVWIEDEAGISFGLCEVHFDKGGALEAWTEEFAMAPSGEDLSALQSDLTRMMTDAYCWTPVQHSELSVGMTFGARISMSDREKIGALIKRWAQELKNAQMPEKDAANQ